MSADFWAGYLSGAIGIVIGNPLDIIKVKTQAGLISQNVSGANATLSLLRGSAAPIIGYGALNSLLFVSYNRSLKWLDPSITDVTKLSMVSLKTIWLAGAAGGLASWIVSAPSEIVKCRAQLGVDGKSSSIEVFKSICRSKGVLGLYHGGLVTSLRDSIGYGFYFWSYELCQRKLFRRESDSQKAQTAILVSGGIAGVVTWASIYPLDAIKTMLQTQPWDSTTTRPLTSWKIAQKTFRTEGFRPFYRGLGVCSLRAFIVNAVQWFTYEKAMEMLQ